jgi:hypothetical protein
VELFNSSSLQKLLEGRYYVWVESLRFQLGEFEVGSCKMGSFMSLFKSWVFRLSVNVCAYKVEGGGGGGGKVAIVGD